jgi:hypothetical protein
VFAIADGRRFAAHRTILQEASRLNCVIAVFRGGIPLQLLDLPLQFLETLQYGWLGSSRTCVRRVLADDGPRQTEKQKPTH